VKVLFPVDIKAVIQLGLNERMLDSESSQSQPFVMAIKEVKILTDSKKKDDWSQCLGIHQSGHVVLNPLLIHRIFIKWLGQRNCWFVVVGGIKRGYPKTLFLPLLSDWFASSISPNHFFLVVGCHLHRGKHFDRLPRSIHGRDFLQFDGIIASCKQLKERSQLISMAHADQPHIVEESSQILQFPFEGNPCIFLHHISRTISGQDSQSLFGGRSRTIEVEESDEGSIPSSGDLVGDWFPTHLI